MSDAERRALAEQVYAEVSPLLEADPYSDKPGYNCCGCSTYWAILAHALRIIDPSYVPPA